MPAFVDMKERLKLSFLTLDYCGKQEIYASQTFPTGTIACDVLNIPAETVDRVLEYGRQSDPP